MKIYSINSVEFKVFGKVLMSPLFSEFETAADKIAIPETGCSYIASVKEFEGERTLSYYRELFGDVDIQIGYCWGRNDRLNAMEWHKSSEIQYALDDMVLLLGRMSDINEDGTFNTASVKAFLLKKGESVEIYQTTLHYCPCMKDSKPFRSVVILPKGTNTPLNNKSKDKRLIAKNKWLICHSECDEQVKAGSVIGVKGDNIVIK